MKNILALTALVFICTLAMAQSPIGKNGTQLNFGLGINSNSLPVYVGFDWGVHPDITLGVQLLLDVEFDYLAPSFRGDYHFNSLLNMPRDWDFYAGLNLGGRIDIDDDYATGLGLGLQIGGRYYWNSNWGVNLELGGNTNDLSGGRFGLSRRF